MNGDDILLATRALERVLIVGAATLCIFLGYRLYLHGITKGQIKWQSSASLVPKVLLSGTGPGLAFMAFGALVLIVAVLKGPVIDTTEVRQPPRDARAPTPSTQPAQPLVAQHETPPATPSTTLQEEHAGGGGGLDDDEGRSWVHKHVSTIR